MSLIGKEYKKSINSKFRSSKRAVDTIMEVSRFITPDWLIEIEVDAIISSKIEDF